jgi:hypothetical protein
VTIYDAGNFDKFFKRARASAAGAQVGAKLPWSMNYVVGFKKNN